MGMAFLPRSAKSWGMASNRRIRSNLRSHVHPSNALASAQISENMHTTVHIQQDRVKGIALPVQFL